MSGAQRIPSSKLKRGHAPPRRKPLHVLPDRKGRDLSGVIIMAASEIAKRSPIYGSLILSLPLISILAFIWLWRDTGDNERIASLAEGTFWLVLPTLPMFLVLPALLRSGIGFWIALAISIAMTIALYLSTVWLLPKVGIDP